MCKHSIAKSAYCLKGRDREPLEGLMEVIAAGSGGRFAGSLGGQLLAGGLASGRFASGLLSTCHC